MRKYFSSVLAAALSVVALNVSSQTLVRSADNELQVTSPIALAYQHAPIKSAADLTTHVSNMPAEDSPLALLSEQQRSRFLASITFNQKGISGYSYNEIRHLTASQAHEILALFGAQRTTSLIADLQVTSTLDFSIMDGAFFVTGKKFGTAMKQKKSWLKLDDDPEGGTDYEGYSCESRANCKRTPGYICMGSC